MIKQNQILRNKKNVIKRIFLSDKKKYDKEEEKRKKQHLNDEQFFLKLISFMVMFCSETFL